MDSEQLLEAIIFAEDRVEYPYKIKKVAYCNYQKSLVILEQLKEQGVLEYEALALEENYENHRIEVKWNIEDEEYVSLEGNQVIDLQ